MSGADGQNAAAFCADLVRTFDFARYASTLFVPAPERRALLALHAFNIEISRVHELVSQPLPGEIRLQWWTDMLAGAGHGDVAGNPVAAELLEAIGDFGLPIEPLSRLIEAHQFDLYNDPMPSQAALEGYLGETVSALFGLGARILRHSSDQIDHLSRHAGLASGIVEIVARLPRDAARQQLFMPLQVLQRHGIGAEQMFAGRPAPEIRAALDELIGQAKDHLEAAFAMLGDVPIEARPAFLPLALLRREIAEMARAGSDPFVPRAVPSRLRVLWTLWRASRRREFGG